jgi:hypothetical protein
VTDDRPILEYGASGYSRRISLPADLFDVRDAEAWCPACLAPGAPGAAGYRAHLSVVGRYYASRWFLGRRAPGAPVALDLPREPEVERAIADSPFLSALLGRQPAERSPN